MTLGNFNRKHLMARLLSVLLQKQKMLL